MEGTFEMPFSLWRQAERHLKGAFHQDKPKS